MPLPLTFGVNARGRFAPVNATPAVMQFLSSVGSVRRARFLNPLVGELTFGGRMMIGMRTVNATPAAMEFFARVASLYRARLLYPLWQKYPCRENDDWEAVSLFLEGYAFERQGAPADFAHAALDAIRRLRSAGVRIADCEVAHTAWAEFAGLLNNRNLNHANNPLCPRDTPYSRRYRGELRPSRTYAPSVFEGLLEILETEGVSNIISYAKVCLEQDRLQQSYQRLATITGIGGKIASLFLRDVASFYGLAAISERHLLQPVDVWVRAVTTQLKGGTPADVGIAKWIVQQSAEPEAVNQGMWYFCSQVAGSHYRVSRSLNDLVDAKALVNEHIGSFRRSFSALEELTL